jgi:hypothetical protein
MCQAGCGRAARRGVRHGRHGSARGHQAHHAAVCAFQVRACAVACRAPVCMQQRVWVWACTACGARERRQWAGKLTAVVVCLLLCAACRATACPLAAGAWCTTPWPAPPAYSTCDARRHTRSSSQAGSHTHSCNTSPVPDRAVVPVTAHAACAHSHSSLQSRPRPRSTLARSAVCRFKQCRCCWRAV